MSGYLNVSGIIMPSKTVPMSGVIQNPSDLGIKAGSGIWRVRYVDTEQDEFEREPEKVSEGGVFFSTKEFKNEDANEEFPQDNFDWDINFNDAHGL